MKPPPFAYSAPTELAGVLADLQRWAGEAKVLAGGQSLLPLLSMRLSAPAALVDINRVPDLDRIRVDDDGSVVVGALVRHARLLADEAAFAAQPLLRRATANVAHPAIRNRGTSVGSIAHADPAAELPTVLVLTGGVLEVASATGAREIHPEDFFAGPLENALVPGELVTAVRFAAPPARSGSAFLELSRRRGDYAMCGVGVVVTLAEDGAVATAQAAYCSVGPGPLSLDLTPAVSGADPDESGSVAWTAGGELAAGQLAADDDLHASAAYRTRLAAVLTERALRSAAVDAVRRATIAA